MVKIQKVKVKGDARDHVKEIVEILGGDRTGSGIYGQAYKIGDDEIIKVFSDDRAYKYYLDAITKMEDNPYVPQIGYILQVTDEHRDVWYLVSMERLRHYDAVPAKVRKQFHNFRDFVREFVGDDRDFETTNITDVPRELVEAAVPDTLLMVMDVIKEGHDAKGMGFDLHTGNVMIRSNGDFVITDPLVY